MCCTPCTDLLPALLDRTARATCRCGYLLWILKSRALAASVLMQHIRSKSTAPHSTGSATRCAVAPKVHHAATRTPLDCKPSPNTEHQHRAVRSVAACAQGAEPCYGQSTHLPLVNHHVQQAQQSKQSVHDANESKNSSTTLKPRYSHAALWEEGQWTRNVTHARQYKSRAS